MTLEELNRELNYKPLSTFKYIRVTDVDNVYVIKYPTFTYNSIGITGEVIYDPKDRDKNLNILSIKIEALEEVLGYTLINDGNFGLPQMSRGRTNKQMVPAILFMIIISILMKLCSSAF